MSDFISRMVGASNHADEARQKNDYYATRPIDTERLLKHEKFSKDVLECACGGGHMAEVLKANGYNVLASDISDYGYGSVVDFFLIKGFNGDIITNPPFMKAEQFIRHAIDIIPNNKKVAMLLRLNFLESKKRQALFTEFPPKTVYVAIERMKMAKNGDFDNYNTGAIAFAWFVWQKGYCGDTILKWC